MLYEKIEGKKVYFTEPDIQNEWTAICFKPTINDCKLTSSLPKALKEYGQDLILSG